MQRRTFLTNALAVLGANLLPTAAFSQARSDSPQVKSSTAITSKRIESSGEWIPIVGMGTWITFNVGNIEALRKQRASVLDAFFKHGGTLIDSSPMYGSSEAVVGDALRRLHGHNHLFSASKIWTSNDNEGASQFNESLALWGINKFDLMQVHNLVNWRNHLDLLRDLKAEGRVKYIGVTTSHGRRHSELEKIMQNEQIDFVQLTYNIADREAEQRLLPLAKDKGIAVIANRPLQGGRLPDLLANKPLPEFAESIECKTWVQLILKYICSHPAMTCAIPATTKVNHMYENMHLLKSRLLTATERVMLLRHFESI